MPLFSTSKCKRIVTAVLLGTALNSAWAAASNHEMVQQLYVAYYGRPADSVTLRYLQEAVDQTGSIGAVAAAFSSAVESTAQFGGRDPGQLINIIYQNLFGRAPDAAGFAYWRSQIEAVPSQSTAQGGAADTSVGQGGDIASDIAGPGASSRAAMGNFLLTAPTAPSLAQINGMNNLLDSTIMDSPVVVPGIGAGSPGPTGPQAPSIDMAQWNTQLQIQSTSFPLPAVSVLPSPNQGGGQGPNQ